MKNLFTAVFFALMLVGCDKSSPTAAMDSSPSSSAVTSTSDVAFSELSMYTIVVAADSLVTASGPDSSVLDSLHCRRDSLYHHCDSLRHANDSLRQIQILGLLRDSLGLTDAQIDSITVYAQTLFTSLDSIHSQLRDSLITKDQALVLVQSARDQFLASLQSILTTDQLTLLDEWIIKFWDHQHEHGYRYGHGHDDDHGGMHGGHR
jgi:hypothetical protein